MLQFDRAELLGIFKFKGLIDIIFLGVGVFRKTMRRIEDILIRIIINILTYFYVLHNSMGH